jgi:pyruvate,water dikinase
MLLNSLFKQWSYRIVAPGVLLREKYETLKKLLHHDSQCHEHMAQFQELLHSEQPEDFCRIRERFIHFSDHVAQMVKALEHLAPGKYTALKDYHKKFDFYTLFLLAPPKISDTPPFLLKLSEILSNNSTVGNKAKHLATLAQEIDIPVPRSFAITTSAFHHFINENNLRKSIDKLLATIDPSDSRSLYQTSAQIQKRIGEAEIPPTIMAALLTEYDSWKASTKDDIRVAVRSSALGEDGDSSFAGQYASVLGVCREELGDAYLQVLASKYSPEALFYRMNKGLSDEETAMSVLVQEMVEAKYSGVLYTAEIDQQEAQPDYLHLHVIQGLGERLVSGEETPDHYVISKQKPAAVQAKTVTEKSLGDAEIQKLAEVGLRIEDFFGVPQDIEWAVDNTDTLHVLQARSLYRGAGQQVHEHEPLKPEKDAILIEDCTRASRGVGSGSVYLVDKDHRFEDAPAGTILVTRNTPASYVTIVDKISGVLAEHGSRASHFATVAREFNIPMLTGIENVTDRFKEGSILTVDGNNGVVYQGRVEALLDKNKKTFPQAQEHYRRIIGEALKFITPLELVDPSGDNFTPEGCRSMHDIIRFSHEKALQSMFSEGRPGTGLGSVKLIADIPLDVYLFDVGGGIDHTAQQQKKVALESVSSLPFQALWKGLSHADVQWKQKPFDWDSYDKIELSGAVAPRKDSFAFASYAVVGTDYLHFNIRFGYHFTIVDVICAENTAENHCMLRFAGGGGDFDHRSLRLDFLVQVLDRLEFAIDKKGDLLEAKIIGQPKDVIAAKLDLLGRLLGASKLMDMVLEDEQMVEQCVTEFFDGRYSFSQEG